MSWTVGVGVRNRVRSAGREVSFQIGESCLSVLLRCRRFLFIEDINHLLALRFVRAERVPFQMLYLFGPLFLLDWGLEGNSSSQRSKSCLMNLYHRSNMTLASLSIILQRENISIPIYMYVFLHSTESYRIYYLSKLHSPQDAKPAPQQTQGAFKRYQPTQHLSTPIPSPKRNKKGKCTSKPSPSSSSPPFS